MQAQLPHIRPENRVRNLGLLLVFVVLLQFGYPITLEGRLATALYMLLYAGMIFFGILTVREEGEGVTIVGALGLVFLVFAIWFTFDQDNRDATLFMLASVATFMAALMLNLMRYVFRTRQTPGSGLVLAAVCVYLIMGGFFGATFSIVEILAPGSFDDPQIPGQSPAWQQLVYYSYVTMATLGYGDILPVTAWARSLATFETVSGTLFLTVVIARLVGVWSAYRARPS